MPKRTCVICNSDNKSNEIYGFDEVLRDLGFSGRYAHPTCVVEAQKDVKRQIAKFGKANAHVQM